MPEEKKKQTCLSTNSQYLDVYHIFFLIPKAATVEMALIPGHSNEMTNNYDDKPII